jgi:hypothetical protein
MGSAIFMRCAPHTTMVAKGQRATPQRRARCSGLKDLTKALTGVHEAFRDHDKTADAGVCGVTARFDLKV